MRRIERLSANLINRIAAGEVVERPAAVVKELGENALDAGATRIEIEVEAGGKRKIRIRDDGVGIAAADLALALEPHATSKLHDAADLLHIGTFGFRGEAVASIASISQFTIRSRLNPAARDRLRARGELALDPVAAEDGSLASSTSRGVEGRPGAEDLFADAPPAGAEVASRFGEVGAVRPVGCPAGTEIEVRELFASTPARFKFLKGASAELSQVVDAVQRLAMPHPEVAFLLTHDGKRVLELAPQGAGGEKARREGAAANGAGSPQPAGTTRSDRLRARIVDFWGTTCGEALREVSHYEPGLAIEGWVAEPHHSRGNGTRIVTFLNGRYIRDRSLLAAAREAYREYLPPGRYPVAVLFLRMPLEAYDVNVHPQKLEVRFREPRRLFARVKSAIRERLAMSATPPRIDLAARFGSATRGREVRPEAREIVNPSGWHPSDGANGYPVPAAERHAREVAGAEAGDAVRAHLRALADRLRAAPPVREVGPAPAGGNAAGAVAADGRSWHAATAAVTATATGIATAPAPASTSGSEGSFHTEHARTWRTRRLLDPPPMTDITTLADGPSPTPVEEAGLAGRAVVSANPEGSYLAGLRRIVQLAGRYLLLEYEDQIHLVDQHALHERVMYAQFEARFRGRALERQRLLIPEPLDLARAEAARLEDPDTREALTRLGFEIRLPSDPNSESEGADADAEREGPALVSVPMILARRLSSTGIRRALESTLASLDTDADAAAANAEARARDANGAGALGADPGTGEGPELPDVARLVIATLACKAAIKAGETMNEEQALALLREAEKLQDAGGTYACPHGRPTTVALRFDDIDRLFDRS